MDVNQSSSSAMEATKYSKYVSLMGIKALENSLNECIEKEPIKNKCGDCNCKNKQGSKEDLMENVCYACKHIIQDLVSIFVDYLVW